MAKGQTWRPVILMHMSTHVCGIAQWFRPPVNGDCIRPSMMTWSYILQTTMHNLAVDITTDKDVISTQDHDTPDSIFSLYYGIIWVCHIHHFISNIYSRQSCCYKLGLKYFINPDIYPFIFAANYLNSLNQHKPRNHNIIHFKFKLILKLLLSRLLCDHFRVLSSSKIIARLSI